MQENNYVALYSIVSSARLGGCMAWLRCGIWNRGARSENLLRGIPGVVHRQPRPRARQNEHLGHFTPRDGGCKFPTRDLIGGNAIPLPQLFNHYSQNPIVFMKAPSYKTTVQEELTRRRIELRARELKRYFSENQDGFKPDAAP